MSSHENKKGLEVSSFFDTWKLFDVVRVGEGLQFLLLPNKIYA